MSRLIITPDAESDIEYIGEYVAQDSARQAEKFLDRLEKQFERLADMPRMGRSHSELGEGVRSLPFRPYLIIYQPIPDGVEILRVLHGARDIRSAFRQPPSE